jgi:hypothetical protein
MRRRPRTRNRSLENSSGSTRLSRLARYRRDTTPEQRNKAAPAEQALSGTWLPRGAGAPPRGRPSSRAVRELEGDVRKSKLPLRPGTQAWARARTVANCLTSAGANCEKTNRARNALLYIGRENGPNLGSTRARARHLTSDAYLLQRRVPPEEQSWARRASAGRE